MATAVLKLLKAKGGEKGGGEGTWAAFLEKTICFFPPSQDGVEGGGGGGGRGEQGRNGHLGSRERREIKDSKMLQEQLS